MTPSIDRVLVTGAAGKIGTAVSEQLAASGVAVTGLSLTGPFSSACDRVVEADATSYEMVSAALRDVDAVVHLAAIPHPNAATPFSVYSTNTAATFAVLSAAGEAGIGRVVVASSINASGIPFNRHRPLPAYFPLDEDLPEDLEDAYSLSKRSGELAATMATRRWGTDIVSIRFPLVKSLPELLRASARATANPAASVREGWSYLEVGDAARAVHSALLAPSLSGAAVIGVSAEDTLVNSPTEALLAAWAPGVPLRRAIRGRATAVDISRARALIGFEPAVSVHDQVAADGAIPHRPASATT